ncbi:tubulin [Ectocarpus siliculosus]|uniref:Tubulin n=1 Tax=Ectocarpus siliculosus TaxID=2880 RepID=D7FR98_ECTSI|nr:tubulin [Ectocarpus siliculosus]|eukprot:CBJ30689.1 tubulin [Ectocarpus siliculosus]
MVREIVSIHVGQCGNQIGRAFWKEALAEHASANVDGVFDDCMSTFFRNVDNRTNRNVAIGDGRQPIYDLKARAILIDMETGPVSETNRGELGELFDERQFVTGVSGAGNNWAHGNVIYGPEYNDELLEAVRRAAETCDSLQSFFLMHSLGGGTGSGLGTYLLTLLEDHFPDVYRFSTVVFPSEDDDVITSPYNSVLALSELTEHAHCVLPVDNASLANIVASWDSGPDLRPVGTGTSSGFDSMNSLVARLLTDLTASMRFAGDLNVDLNEITTNLVPFPRLHYLLSSVSPLPTRSSAEVFDGRTIPPAAAGFDGRPRRMAQMFSGAFSASNMLMRADPRFVAVVTSCDCNGTGHRLGWIRTFVGAYLMASHVCLPRELCRRSKFLACGLLVRGEVVVSDVNANIERLAAELDMVHWNPEGYKIGLCSVPPVGTTQSLLCLSNNCCIM